MALKLKKTVNQLCAEAEKEIQTITPQEAIKLKDDPGVLLVDIRDIRELQRDGRVPGALHAPRGMLEFWVDPESPYYKEVFGSGKKFMFFCAGGMRSALAARVGSHPHTSHEYANRDWANSSAVPRGSELFTTSSQSRMN